MQPYQRTDPKSDEYFNQPERKGGPTDPLLWFHELFEILLKGKYQRIEDYPLYKWLCQFSAKASDSKQPESNKKNDKADEENKDGASKPDKNKNPDAKNWKRNYDELSHYDKLDMLVDEIFALYLYRTSRKTNEMFYKTILAYVIFFRECLNKIGWQKRIESDEVLLEEQPELAEAAQNYEFCLTNTAEHAPEICNDFVTIYMDQNRHLMEISKPDQIDLTINLCHWLFENQFTCSKLSMIT